MKAVLAGDVPGTIRIRVDLNQNGNPEAITVEHDTQQTLKSGPAGDEISAEDSRDSEIPGQDLIEAFMRWSQTQWTFSVPRVHGVAVSAQCEFTLDLTEAHQEESQTEEEPSL